MNQLNYSTKSRKFKQLNEKQRYTIEKLLNDGYSQSQISKLLGVHRSTISREIKRGSIEQTKTIFGFEKEVIVYYHDAAQTKANDRNKKSRKKLKVLGHYDYLKKVSDEVKNNKYSFEIISGRINYLNTSKNENSFNVSFKTLYNYFKKGLFKKYGLTVFNLPRMVSRKTYNKRNTTGKRDCRGNSIEIRPENINNRSEAMHWEIDCVIGKLTKSPVLLTLTERLTRFELIFKLPEKKTSEVVKVIDYLELTLKDNFKDFMKSITSDNGSEFADFEGIQKSIIDQNNNRTTQYYAHPYCSSERGTNEAMNGRIRKFYPKKTDFTKVSEKSIKKCQNALNNQPKKCLNFKTSYEAILEHFNKPELIKALS